MNEDNFNENNKSKKVLLSVLGVAILVVAVVGVSFAAFSFINNNANENSIATGTITMSYSEPTAGITLKDQLPITDAEGKVLKGTSTSGLTDDPDSGNTYYFDFTVSTTTTGKVAVPYEISVSPVAIAEGAGVCSIAENTTSTACTTAGGTWTAYAQLPANNVKVYLTEVNGSEETEVVAPTLVSDLDNYVLYTKTNLHSSSNIEYKDKYKLRIWIDNSVTGEGWTESTKLQYNFKIGVESNQKAKTSNLSDSVVTLSNSNYI